MKITYVGELVAGKVIADGRAIWFTAGQPIEVSDAEAKALAGPDWSEDTAAEKPSDPPADAKKSRSRRAIPADESTQTQEV